MGGVSAALQVFAEPHGDLGFDAEPAVMAHR
jgi:hypothetical protein